MIELDVLTASVDALRATVEKLSPDELRAPAYPSEWTVAQVLSHLGSSAEIFTASVDTGLGGAESSPQPVWDRWNAKDPDTQAADFVRADRALVDRLDALTAEERERFGFTMGPLDLDLPAFIRMRINEHTLHRWDVDVVRDPQAALSSAAVPLVLEAVPMIAGWAGRTPEGGATLDTVIATTDPEHRFALTVDANGVRLAPAGADHDAPALELPAEALIRLVYGRLDAAHTPPVHGEAALLDAIRPLFPGM
jgi:uncharacterized protein (TIGR03083 family)